MTAIHPLNNSQLQSNVNAASYTMTNVVDPSSDQDAATKKYVDVTHSGLPNAHHAQAHKDTHNPRTGTDPLNCLAPDTNIAPEQPNAEGDSDAFARSDHMHYIPSGTPAELVGVQASAEGVDFAFARTDHAHQVQHSIADNHIVTVDGVANQPVNTDYAAWTANGLEGRDKTQMLTFLNVADGADVAGANHPHQDVTTTASPRFAGLYVDEYIYHYGDADTYIRLQDNEFELVVEGEKVIWVDPDEAFTLIGVSFDMQNNKIKGLPLPASATDAATKGYVDTKMASVYPVGSVYISVVATNPNTLFGFGTWSAIGAGQVLVGLDSGDADFDTVEKTGGSKTHALTTAELATHTHVQNQHTHTQNSHDHAFSNGGSGVTLNNGASGPYNYAGSNCCVYTSGTTASRTATNQNTTPTNQNTGSGDAHTSVQPYFVVYMWKRTA